MTPENLSGLTVTAEQLGAIWTPPNSGRARHLGVTGEPCPPPPDAKAPSTISKIAA